MESEEKLTSLSFVGLRSAHGEKKAHRDYKDLKP